MSEAEYSETVSEPDISNLKTWDINVGKITGRWDHSHLKVMPLDASPQRFDTGSKLCVQFGAQHNGRRILLEVLSSRRQGKHRICDCGLKTSEEADALIGGTLWVHRSMRPTLAEGEFYLDEVLGLRVVTNEGEDLGEIVEVLASPAHNIYVTKIAMIPAHNEFVLDTNWKERVLTVRAMPGLKIDE